MSVESNREVEHRDGAFQEARPTVERPTRQEGGQRRPARRRWLWGVAAIAILAGIGYAIDYWVHSWSYVSTDDAFITGNIVQLSPRVPGHVLRVYVDDNQLVKKGDLLVELDPSTYEASLHQAQGQLAAAEAQRTAAELGVNLTQTTSEANLNAAKAGVQSAQAGVTNAQAQVHLTRSQLSQAQAKLDSAKATAAQVAASITAAQAQARLAEKNLARSNQLLQQGATTPQEHDIAVEQVRTSNADLAAAQREEAAAQARVTEAQSGVTVSNDAVKQAEAQLAVAKAGVVQAEARQAGANVTTQQVGQSKAQVHVAKADIERLRAAVKQASLSLSYTKVYAAVDGRVTQKNVDPGDYFQAGQAMMALVEPDVWVVANFKETELSYIRPGQAVTVYVDAYPGQPLQGQVNSIQRGSGAAFSLLPPENATGNYVKVVQRVPVKIVFDSPAHPGMVLGPGMSVVPEVHLR